VLASQRGPCRVDTDAALAMAGCAHRRLVERGTSRATCGDRVTRNTRKVGRNIADFLVGQARRLRRHCRVLARAFAIAPQGDLNVSRLLATELRDAVGRVGVAIAVDAVASKAGVSEFFASRSITFGVCGLCETGHCEKQRRGASCDFHVRNHLVFPLFQTPARAEVANDAAMVVTLGPDFYHSSEVGACVHASIDPILRSL